MKTRRCCFSPRSPPMPARYEPVEQEDEPLASKRSSSQPPPQRSLGSGTKLAFGIGAVGDSVFGGMFNGFITIYFNQAVGLNNSLIGTAIMLAMISDAVCNVRRPAPCHPCWPDAAAAGGAAADGDHQRPLALRQVRPAPPLPPHRPRPRRHLHLRHLHAPAVPAQRRRRGGCERERGWRRRRWSAVAVRLAGVVDGVQQGVPHAVFRAARRAGWGALQEPAPAEPGALSRTVDRLLTSGSTLPS
eukprot:COSAG04_NODE_691_length_11104_cov_6.949841_7_plen_245_part_00